MMSKKEYLTGGGQKSGRPAPSIFLQTALDLSDTNVWHESQQSLDALLTNPGSHYTVYPNPMTACQQDDARKSQHPYPSKKGVKEAW